MDNQIIDERYALYNGDCIKFMQKMPDGCIDLSIYSPPFATDRGGCLYTYSSLASDLSNSLNKDEFFTHYKFVVEEIHRLTKPGRMTAVHSMDVPSGNTGLDCIYDYPGDIIRLHESLGFRLAMRFFIWKEPLLVRNRTMTKSLSHKGITEDSTRCSNAVADQLLIFRRSGKNEIPVTHKEGFRRYVGERKMPATAREYKGWTGSQLQNKYSHWIWRQYASAFWDDVRIDRVLAHRAAKGQDDERHCHPLQLDVIERCVVMFSNPNEVVLSPFMGVGSEVFGAVINGRRGIGIDIHPNYFKQACANLKSALDIPVEDQGVLIPADSTPMTLAIA